MPKKSRNRQAKLRPPPTPAVVPGSTSPPMNTGGVPVKEPQARTSWWTTGDYVGLGGGAIALFGLVVAILAWTEARESRKIAAEAQTLSQKSYDRASGKVGAKFAIVGFSPPPDKLPDPIKYRVSGQDEVRLSSLPHLRLMSPRVRLKNTGEEPIDAVRLETKTELVGVEFGGKIAEKEFGMMAAWRHGHVETEDIPFGRKLLPGETASVPLTRGLLSQMMRLHAPEAADKNNFVRFDVRCYGRVVGATAFDNADGGARSAIRFVWVPNGFPEDEIKKFLETERAAVEVE